MKHRNTIDIYQYWNILRGDRNAPDRTEIEPSDIRALLKDIFILEHKAADNYGFRLAGTRICAMFGREMKNRNFLNLSHDDTNQALQTILHSTIEDSSVNVLGFVGKNDAGHPLALEAIFLPVHLNGGKDTRILGTITPLRIPFWMGMQPVRTLELSSFRMILPHQHNRAHITPAISGEEETIVDLVTERERLKASSFALKDPTTGGRRVRHLVVLDGGAN